LKDVVKARPIVRQIRSDKHLEKAFSIRLRVFVKEQGVPRDIELDRHDETATHFLAVVGDRPVGTARVVIRNGSAKIGRMAVLKSYRRKGVGTELLKKAVRLARRRKAKRIFLNAQIPVIGFYEKMGFRCAGRVFDEAEIPHRKMVLLKS
jgi:predicted GNAT family N-acyltransferase